MEEEDAGAHAKAQTSTTEQEAQVTSRRVSKLKKRVPLRPHHRHSQSLDLQQLGTFPRIVEEETPPPSSSSTAAGDAGDGAKAQSSHSSLRRTRTSSASSASSITGTTLSSSSRRLARLRTGSGSDHGGGTPTGAIAAPMSAPAATSTSTHRPRRHTTSNTNGLSMAAGIVVGVRRRTAPRMTLSKRLSQSSEFDSDDEKPPIKAEKDQPQTKRPLVKRKSSKSGVSSAPGPSTGSSVLTDSGQKAKSAPTSKARARGLKIMAALIRNRMKHKAEREGVQRRQSFASIASQVVHSKRAAKGFLAMWAKDGDNTVHVYQGIHMEKKKLHLKTVASEYKEIRRRQFYQELVVYLVFLCVFFSLLNWLPVRDSYHQNDVVGFSTCTEDGVCELNKFSDVYEFVNNLHDRLCERQDVIEQWTRVGGVRFRQVRVREEQCKMYEGWYTPCYPDYSPEVEEKNVITSQSGRVYEWNDRLGLLEPISVTTSIWFSFFRTLGFDSSVNFGKGGYAVDLCSLDVASLQEDEWLGVSTRAFSVEFLLMNPITRIITVGSHVFVVSPSGHMNHYPQSANLRVIGLEHTEVMPSTPTMNSCSPSPTSSCSSDDSWFVMTKTPARSLVVTKLRKFWQKLKAIVVFDHRIVLWILLVVFFITYCIGEATEMSTMGTTAYLSADMWNVFELMHLTALFGVLFYVYRYYFACKRWVTTLQQQPDQFFTKVDKFDFTPVQDTLTTFQLLSDFASMASAVSLLKVFKFLRMNSTLNLLWQVLGMALRDLMGFMVIFNLIFLGYSAMGSFAFGFALEEFSTISKSYATCFRMLGGEMDYSRLRLANPRLAPLFFVTFIVLVGQVLVNMFVAILSEYYEFAKNGIEENGGEDVEYDVMTRVRNYLSSCSPTVVVKKNEVIRLVPDQQVRLISTNLVDQEATRQRAKKLFRGAVWRVVALLRFGVKFDRRIQFERKSNNTASKDAPTAETSSDLMIRHIRLSENFDHKEIKEMIPTGITISLKGDSLLGNGVSLKVVRHNKLSVECVVLGANSSMAPMPSPHAMRLKSFGSRRWNSSDFFSGASGNEDDEDYNSDASNPRQVLELLGGEKLHIPYRLFALHVLKSLLKEVRLGLMRATKLWNISKPHLVDDYHLGLLFEKCTDEGKESLRYDEVYRMLDLYLRRDRRKSQCSQSEVRQEALEVMYRFRKCLIDMPSREKEGHNYVPKPVDTNSVELGPLEHLADMLAENCHEAWSLERLKQGWKYGPERDDEQKLHPNLVPYHCLSKEEQAFDYRSSVETLKTIIFMNYSIARAGSAGAGKFKRNLTKSTSGVSDTSTHSTGDVQTSGNTSASENECSTPKPAARSTSSLRREAYSFRRQSLVAESKYFTLFGENNEVYRPLPIDTSSVDMPLGLLRLVDLLAENAHEVWSRGRMNEGWTYGPQRDDKAKKHPCLVPYIFLTEAEKEYDINIAKETIKTLLAMNFIITDRSSG